MSLIKNHREREDVSCHLLRELARALLPLSLSRRAFIGQNERESSSLPLRLLAKPGSLVCGLLLLLLRHSLSHSYRGELQKSRRRRRRKSESSARATRDPTQSAPRQPLPLRLSLAKLIFFFVFVSRHSLLLLLLLLHFARRERNIARGQEEGDEETDSRL